MKNEKVKLKEGGEPRELGLYKIWWDSGGSSLVAVGITHDGSRWYSPCNWTTDNNSKPMVASTNWSYVKAYRLIKAK